MPTLQKYCKPLYLIWLASYGVFEIFKFKSHFSYCNYQIINKTKKKYWKLIMNNFIPSSFYLNPDSHCQKLNLNFILEF